MGLMLFGTAAVTVMLVTYALEPRSRHFTLAFAGGCLAAAAYAAAVAAWPFAVLEAAWSLVALRRWALGRVGAAVR